MYFKLIFLKSQSEMHVGKCTQCVIQPCVQCPNFGLILKKKTVLEKLKRTICIVSDCLYIGLKLVGV